MRRLEDDQLVDENGNVWTEVIGLSYEQALAFHEIIHAQDPMIHLHEVDDPELDDLDEEYDDEEDCHEVVTIF